MENDILRCDWPTFRQHYLPFNPTEKQVQDAMKVLEPNYLRKRGRVYHWTRLRQPSKTQDKKKNIFDELANVFAQLRTYPFREGRDRALNFEFRHHPDNNMTSDIGGGNNKIDGSFQPLNNGIKDGPVATFDVAVAAEFKRIDKLEFIYDNRIKVVSAANQIMNDDVRRAFMYGMTIEGEQTTIWYFSRSHTAMSEPFDFFDDKESLVAFALSFMFATREEMGYDSCIAHSQDGSFFYRIPVGHGQTRTFKTGRSVGGYRNLCISGRTTRVWEAVETDQNEHPISDESLALKDVWLVHDASTERDIQTSIFNDVSKFANSGIERHAGFSSEMKDRINNIIESDSYKDYFLTIECDYFDGPISKQPPPNAVKPNIPVLTAPTSASAMRPFSRFYSDPVRSVVPSSAGETSALPYNHYRQYKPKKRYLLLYKEVCKPLHHLDSLQDIFKVLEDSLVALQLLYCAGWVHRDISSGNILSFTTPGTSAVRGKLSDLEYAKKFPSDSSDSDPKTGTPFFMPLEIQRQEFLYTPSHGNQDFSSDGRLPERRRKPMQPVQFNFQHDLESLWWILLWTVTQGPDHAASREFARLVFHNSSEAPRYRAAVIMTDSYLWEKLTEVLHPFLQKLAPAIDMAVFRLRQEYIRREETEKLYDHASYSEIHRSFFWMFENLKEISLPSLKLDLRHRRSVGGADSGAKRQATEKDDSESKSSKKRLRASIDAGTLRRSNRLATRKWLI